MADNGNGNNVKIQPLERRLEPCPRCFRQSGLIWDEDYSLDATQTVSNSTNLHVAIIGGGIGGLALATALLHRGISCQVYEKDTCFDQRSQGYGLTLQQARRALLALGIKDDGGGDACISEDGKATEVSFLKGDAVTSTKHVVHTTDGTVIGEWGLRKWGKSVLQSLLQ